MKELTALWCAAGAKLLTPVHQVPLIRLVTMRVGRPVACLVPWTPDLDHIAAELKEMRLNVARCWPEERIAMRDLMVDREAEVGALIHGDCGVIDADEVELEFARVRSGKWDADLDEEWDKWSYRGERAERVACFKLHHWLQASHTDEWRAPCSPAELQAMIPPGDLTARLASVRLRRGP